MSRTWPAVALLVFVALTLVVDPRPASAACAVPSPSPYRFTGLVLRTSNDGLLATVRTDDGRTVVIGTSDTRNEPYQRTYRVGVRYEFDPTNDTSPYFDSMCTETHEIDGGAPVAVPWVWTDAVPWLWWTAPFAIPVLLVVGLAVRRAWIRRDGPQDGNRQA